MSLSDILTILGLIAAIIAFVSEKNREYLFLKFSVFDIMILLAGFLLTNYLIAFDWFVQKGLYCSSLIWAGWPLSSIWAYFVTLFLLVYLFYRTYYGFFPAQNKNKVIAYYHSQVLKTEFSFLVSLIEKFHKKDIIKFLEKLPDLVKEDAKSRKKKSGKNVSVSNRLIYAGKVFGEIIIDEKFLDNTVNTNPYLFTDFIEMLSTTESANEDFVHRYLSILITNNNYHLIRELKNNRNLTTEKRYRLPEENKILRALFLNINVAHLNQVWQPYGDLTCKYLEEESEKKFSILRGTYKDTSRNEDWSTLILQSLWFFEIMITEAIAQNVKSHMHLFYLRSFTKRLIDNIPDERDADVLDDNIPSQNHYFIHEIVDTLCGWIELSATLKRNNINNSVCDCLGQCLYLIATTSKTSDTFKVYCFDRALSQYFELSNTEDAEDKREAMEKCFVTPKMGFPSRNDAHKDQMYVKAMSDTWRKFDKVPYQGFEENGSIESFKTNVLKPLKINP